jgi:hypothetical protein
MGNPTKPKKYFRRHMAAHDVAHPENESERERKIIPGGSESESHRQYNFEFPSRMEETIVIVVGYHVSASAHFKEYCMSAVLTWRRYWAMTLTQAMCPDSCEDFNDSRIIRQRI